MENRKIGFIGAGKMGSALMQGIIKAGIVNSENISASDVYEPFLNELKTKLGIQGIDRQCYYCPGIRYPYPCSETPDFGFGACKS